MRLGIDGIQLEYFSAFNLTLNYNSLASVFSFNMFFIPDDPVHRRVFRPLAYKQATVEHNGELLVTGTLLSHNFSDAPAKQLTAIGGYSLPGVLEDCEIPVSLYPLESVGLSLRELAQKLIRPFGLKMKIDSSASSAMEKTYSSSTADERQSIKEYLSSLASQRNVVLSHTEKGELLFTMANTKRDPIMDFTRGMPGTKMSLQVAGQDMHSSITVYKQADSFGENAGQSVISNPLVKAYRPKVRTQSSGNDNNTAEAARTALSEELKAVKLIIETDRWELGGKIIKPNNIISVTNPELYIYKKTNFFIESISFSGDEKQTTAILTCGLPSVYDRTTPHDIFL